MKKGRISAAKRREIENYLDSIGIMYAKIYPSGRIRLLSGKLSNVKKLKRQVDEVSAEIKSIEDRLELERRLNEES
jgi:hypothetical protein